MTHPLKSRPVWFQAAWEGKKTYEIRRADRDYRPGDALRIREWAPTTSTDTPSDGFTGREILVAVTHVTPSGEVGLPDDLCVMGFRLVEQTGGP